MSVVEENRGFFSRLSSFSLILIMVVGMVVGGAMIPLLNIQYTPTVKEQSLSVNFSWPNASAMVIEQEVTSKIEGVLSTVRGVKNIKSVSRRGLGEVSVTFKGREGSDAIRFEIASLLRRLYPELPSEVSFPTISLSTRGTQQSSVLTYTLNANLSPQQIVHYAENHLQHPLSTIEGVHSVTLSGATPNYIEVHFSPEELSRYGLQSSHLSAAIATLSGTRESVGRAIIEEGGDDGEGGDQLEMLLLLTTSSTGALEELPIGNVEGRIVRLGDVASTSLRERLPSSYYRVNGLNTINITIYPEREVNTLRLVEAVKGRMAQLERAFPESYSVLIAQDSSTYIKNELNKIVLRTTLSLLILLAFVFLVSRNLRYLFVIVTTLVANILVAFIFYNLFSIQLHLYSLAGVTVSLGIIIDTAIIMIDHYGYHMDRRVFIAILAALLTTIASLLVVFLLPDALRLNLVDFAAVIIINLTISLLIALLFIPALMEKVGLRQKMEQQSVRTKRRMVKITALYKRVIGFERRWRWVIVLLTIIAFGIPLHLLPVKLEPKRGEELSRVATLYNKSIGGPLYQGKIKEPLEVALGGSFRLFYNGIKGKRFYREPAREELVIGAGMVEGATVQQLNEVLMEMENFLSQFDEIEQFTTEISSYERGAIRVTFKKEAEKSSFPLFLRAAVDAKAKNWGGAYWNIHGVTDHHFSNKVFSGGGGNPIRMSGYNYERLYRYAEQLSANLLQHERVQNVFIRGELSWGGPTTKSEYYIAFDPEKLALYNLTIHSIYSAISRLLSDQSVGVLYSDNSLNEIKIVTDQVETFDLWHLNNHYIEVGGVSIRLSDVATIEMRKMGNDIYRENQEYYLYVTSSFIGSHELVMRVIDEEIRAIEEVMALGFLAEYYDPDWERKLSPRHYLLLLLVIVIIYFIGAILLESLKQPLAIISLIPISFIGVFLTFYFTGFRFDEGGFSAFILLSGIVVNAGFYVVNEYNHIARSSKQTPLRNYLKAYNNKIIPILLTILSTILGLIPFLFEGPSEVFWFSFAIGTMGGMLFNFLSLVFYLPLFISLK